MPWMNSKWLSWHCMLRKLLIYMWTIIVCCWSWGCIYMSSGHNAVCNPHYNHSDMFMHPSPTLHAWSPCFDNRCLFPSQSPGRPFTWPLAPPGSVSYHDPYIIIARRMSALIKVHNDKSFFEIDWHVSGWVSLIVCWSLADHTEANNPPGRVPPRLIG